MMGARELLPVFFSYCRRMLRAFLLVALGGATLFVVTILYRAPLELPLYTCCLVGAVGAVFFFSGFARYYRRHTALRMLRAQCATKLAALPAPRDILEKDYGDIIAALERNRLSAAADAAHREADATEYYTLWSHQIKTPLAAMRLLLQESPDIPGRSAFAQELFKAEQYVDMVLGYLRIGSIHADLSPQEVPLEALVRESVKKVSTLFIHQKSTTLQISSLPGTVLTDKKWFSFVLEQILTNAAKYTPRGTLRWFCFLKRCSPQLRVWRWGLCSAYYSQSCCSWRCCICWISQRRWRSPSRCRRSSPLWCCSRASTARHCCTTWCTSALPTRWSCSTAGRKAKKSQKPPGFSLL